MGTRNLTVVIKDNKIKLSQYGQFDGYFSCTGVYFLEFVKKYFQSENEGYAKRKLEEFGEKIDVLKEVDKDYYDELIKVSDKYDTDVHTNKSKYAIPFVVMFPQFHRNTGVKILDIIMDGITSYEFGKKYKFPIVKNLDKDGFTEFINIINLDTKEVYMLTTHSFNIEGLSTCRLVERTFKHQRCWYKSEIKDIPSISEVEEYKKSIELDYYLNEEKTEWVNY